MLMSHRKGKRILLILYRSKYGATKKYAAMLKEELACDVFESIKKLLFCAWALLRLMKKPLKKSSPTI